MTVTIDGESDDAPRAVTGHVDTLGSIVAQIKADDARGVDVLLGDEA